MGLLKDIASAFSDLKINIIDHKSDHLTKQHARVTIFFKPVRGVAATIIQTNIKKIAGVESVAIKQ